MLKNHKELAGFHRELNDDEFQQLEENILQVGMIIDPIKTWQGYVIDGRHRLKVAERHGIEYKTVEMEFESLQEAKRYVIADQLGKRNLTPSELERLRVTLAMLGEDTKSIAEKTGVSMRTAQRDVEQGEIIGKLDEDIRERYDMGNLIPDRSDFKRFSELSDQQQASVQHQLRADPSLTMKQVLPKREDKQHFEELDGIAEVSPLVAERIASGSIYVTEDSVKQYVGLEELDKELVIAMLEDEVRSLPQAIASLAPPEPVGKQGKEEDIKKAIEKHVDSIASLLDDLHAIKPNLKNRDIMKSKVDAVRNAW